MGSSIGLAAVTLVSIFVESVLYGYFTVLFVASTVILLRKYRSTRQAINKPMLIASITMFIMGTIHVGVDLRRLMDAFLDSPNPVASLNQVNTKVYLLKSTAYTIQTLTGDAFILYRLHLVWKGDRRVVYPILICFIASIGVVICTLRAFAMVSSDAPVFISALHKWIVSFFSLTLFTNFSATLLIASRIWYMHRRANSLMRSGGSILPAMVVIVESGSIYSGCLIILLTLYLSGNFAQYILLDAVTQVIGIVFSLVIVRVALGLSSDEPVQTRTNMTTFRITDVGERSTNHLEADSDTRINMKPIKIEKTVATMEYA